MRNSQPRKTTRCLIRTNGRRLRVGEPKRQSSTRNQKFLTVVPLVNLPKSCSRVQVSDAQLTAEKNTNSNSDRYCYSVEGQRAQEAEVLTRNHKFLTRLPLANLPKSCSRVPAAMTLVSEKSMDEDVAKDDVCFNNDFDFGSFCMVNIKKQHSISSS